MNDRELTTREALVEINARTKEDFIPGSGRTAKLWRNIGGKVVERGGGEKRHLHRWTDSIIEQAVVWVRLRKMLGELSGHTEDGARTIRENLVDYIGELGHKPTYLVVNYDGEVWELSKLNIGKILTVPASIVLVVPIHFDCHCPS